MRWILILLSQIYCGIHTFYKKMYSLGIFKTHRLSVPVLSIGNLTVGGSGKTPVMIYLVNLFQKKKYKIAVVSKNYKSKIKKISKINSQLNGAADYGDEPYLINQKTQSIGYVGPKKYLTAKEVTRNEKVDYIFIDDGFQHHSLFKNCNILLIDVTQWEYPAKLLPWGRYRDDFFEIEKAHILFWTKTNLISPQAFVEMKKKLNYRGPQFEIQFLTDQFLDTLNNEKKQIFELPKKVVLFCGLANPGPLIRGLKDVNKDLEIIVKLFPDHFQYRQSDITKILEKPLNFKYFLTTEKDYVKIKSLWPRDCPLGILLLDLKLNREDKELYEVVSQYLS